MLSIYLSNKRNMLDRKRKHQSRGKLIRENNEHEFALPKELKTGEKNVIPRNLPMEKL